MDLLGLDLSCLACEQCVQLRTGEQLDLVAFEMVLSRAGRSHGPALLLEACTRRVLRNDVLAAVALFDAAGFTIDGKPADRPAGPVRLWRGCPEQHRYGWSWSRNHATAERFAEGGLRGRMPGRVYQLDAPTEALLCMHNGRNEAEYVVDTRGLSITELAQ